MKAIKIIFSVIYWFIVTFLVVVASSTALASLKLPIDIKLFTVQSGSMEPSIKTGSVVVVKNETSYRINDVITFFTTDKRNTTTHRIFNIKESNYKPLFITKGDANRAEDREEIKEENILGKVIFTIPYLGYVVSFTKTQMGFIFLIVVPAVIIIFSEILNLKKEVLRLIRTKTLILTLFLCFVSLFLLKHTNAVFSDTEKISGNSIKVGVWDTVSTPTNTPAITPTSTPSPTPTSSPLPSNVVVNEIYYDSPQSGTDNEFEWFELYNNNDSDITLNNWTITDNVSPDTIPQVTIPGKGFAVIAANSNEFYTNFSNTSGSPIAFISDNYIGNGLGNGGDRLILKDNQGVIIDQISYGSDTTILNPSIPLVNAGSSSERNPKGIDTDSATDFINRNPPTPGN